MAPSPRKDASQSAESLKALYQARLARALLLSQPLCAAHHQRSFFEPAHTSQTSEGKERSHERLGLWQEGTDKGNGPSAFKPGSDQQSEEEQLFRALPAFFELHSGWSCWSCASLLVPGLSARSSSRRGNTTCILCGAEQIDRSGEKLGARQFSSTRKSKRNAAHIVVSEVNVASDLRSAGCGNVEAEMSGSLTKQAQSEPIRGHPKDDDVTPQSKGPTVRPLDAGTQPSTAPRTLEERQKELKRKRKLERSGFSATPSDEAQGAESTKRSAHITNVAAHARETSAGEAVSPPTQQRATSFPSASTQRLEPTPHTKSREKDKPGKKGTGSSYKDAVREMLAKSHKSSTDGRNTSGGGLGGFLGSL